MGHAFVAMSLPGADPVQKISIIPRGLGALGYTMQRPKEDRYLSSKGELEDKLCVLLGGRAAEKVFFDEVSTGAADDLQKATEIARNMVTRFAMIDELGPVTYELSPSAFLDGLQGQKPSHISEDTLRQIDNAIRNLIQEAEREALDLVDRNRQLIGNAAQVLLEKEALSSQELSELFRPSNIGSNVAEFIDLEKHETVSQPA